MTSLLEVLRELEPLAQKEKAEGHGNFPINLLSPLQTAIVERFGDRDISIGPKFLVFAHCESLASGAFYNVLAARGPGATEDWLGKVMNVQKAQIRLVIEVVGLELNGQVIEFSNTVRVGPPDKLSASAQSKALAAEFTGMPLIDWSSLVHTPTIATYEEWFEASEDGWASPSREPIDRALLGLSISGELFPFTGFFWTEFVDIDLELATTGMSLAGSRPSLHEVGSPNEEALEYAEKFLKLKDSHLAGRCKIAASRLRAARIKWDHPGEKVIDIAIALETLLAPENAPEIGHRLKT